MKKLFILIFLSVISFNAIHADITWTLSDDGTLTISGTEDMPDYYESQKNCAPWYSQKEKIKKVVIENGVTSIGMNAFRYCDNLTSIVIPNSLKSIGDYAFINCTSLTSVTIPNSVTSIGYYAFYGCSGLTSVTIPNSVTTIGLSAFYGCSGLTSVTIPNSVTRIRNSVFYGCSGLTSVTIPNSVTSIGYQAFSSCSGLTSITIPNSVTSIGDQAFSSCSGLTSITIPNSVTSIGYEAFYGTKWYDNQPDGIVYAGKVLYKYKGQMPSNTQIDIKEGTKTIVKQAFHGCSGLTSLTIPNSVTSIGDAAFGNCSGLTSVTIPNSVTSIGDAAFGNCYSLTSVTIGTVFKNLYNIFSTGCLNITSVTLLDGVTSIGNNAFSGCDGLTSVTIPNSVTSIGDQAFAGCTGLTSLTIPNSVTSIGYQAFYGCSKIKEIYSWNTTPPSASSKTFENMNTLHAKLFVSEGSGDAYKFAEGWMNFFNIYEMEYTPVLAEADPITISDSKPTVTKGYYKEKSVTYMREGDAITKDNYASFCLPFAVDPADAQFKAVYLPVGLALYNTEMNTLRIGFYKTNEIIPVGTPFLAQLAVDDKVQIKNALPVNYTSDSPAVKAKAINTFNFNDVSGIMSENNDYAINFNGTYKKVSPANANTFNTDGSVGASANVSPFRAYVTLTKNSTNAKIVFSFDEDVETTGIDKLRITNYELPVYDLNGRKVNGKVLKSGIYIKNGKKFVK